LYIKDLKKQADDIDLMIERMEEQIKSLSTSYKTEIEEIEVGCVLEITEIFHL
jgi:dynein regulatory complex protein 1